MLSDFFVIFSLKFGMWSSIWLNNTASSFFFTVLHFVSEKNEANKIESVSFVKQPKQRKLKVLCFVQVSNEMNTTKRGKMLL